MENTKFIQVGFTALRDPRTGTFLPAVPMYIKAEDAKNSGYENMESDISKTLTDWMGIYIKECRKVGVNV